jgi:hypothetical protein
MYTQIKVADVQAAAVCLPQFDWNVAVRAATMIKHMHMPVAWQKDHQHKDDQAITVRQHTNTTHDDQWSPTKLVYDE